MKEIDKVFTVCPACGSSDRFCETLQKEMQEKGFSMPNWQFRFDIREGVAIDKRTENKIPYGSEIPGFIIKTDICLDCGCVYAVELHSHPAKKTLASPDLLPDMGGKQHPFLKNPVLS